MSKIDYNARTASITFDDDWTVTGPLCSTPDGTVYIMDTDTRGLTMLRLPDGSKPEDEWDEITAFKKLS